jgi:flagellar hook-associated protein 2
LLVISGSQTGASTGFTINNSLTNSTGSTVTFAAGQSATSGNMQNAQNAALNVNGIAVTSTTNTVTGAIPGVSLALTKTGEASVNVVPDYSAAEASISSIVNDYNSIQSFYGQEETTDSNGNAMPLDNDPALRQTLRSLESLFNESSSGDPSGLTNLAQIGIEFNENGQLTFDQSTFESATATSPSSVQTFLQGTDGTGGIMATLQSTLHSVDPVDGLINTETQSVIQSESATQSQIQSEQVRLSEEQQALQAKFDAADNLMTQLNSLQGAISSLSASSGSSSSSSSSKNLSSSVN